jgi:nucleotide exchange factor SIL1
MKSLSIICLLILIISTVAEQSESKLNLIFLLLLQVLFLDSENTEEFIPTNEWQIVKEGIFHKFTYKKTQFLFHSSDQKIPPGLHVRLNLETGLREAKLLDKDEEQPSSNNLIPVSSGEQ